MHEYLGLEGGPPMFRQDFTCPALLESDFIIFLTRTGLSPAMAQLSRRFRFLRNEGTGLVRVRSPLLTESRLMSFPPGTEMFQFPGFASPALCIQSGDTLSTSFRPENNKGNGGFSPFGNLRIKGCSHLPEAYRSVPRPSSPVHAKASTECS